MREHALLSEVAAASGVGSAMHQVFPWQSDSGPGQSATIGYVQSHRLRHYDRSVEALGVSMRQGRRKRQGIGDTGQGSIVLERAVCWKTDPSEILVTKKRPSWKVSTMRRLSKLAFANASVEDTVHTLAVKVTEEGDAGHEEATALRAFASSEGSLSKLNFLGGVGGADDTSAALVDDNDTKLMIRMVARKGESVHGA